MSSIVELQNAGKTFRRGSELIQAVRDITLSVNEGEFVAIVGPSGSGKTTLLNLIGCVERPDSGHIRIDGQETDRLPERDLTKIRAKKIGFVFQQFFLLPTLTAQENVELPTLFTSNGAKSRSARELLDLVGLTGRAKHLPAQLSGGEMQRVAIARALINRPKILLADEPTGNLDSHNAGEIVNVFRKLNASGLTILMVTHNLELAEHANRLIHVKDGMIETKGEL